MYFTTNFKTSTDEQDTTADPLNPRFPRCGLPIGVWLTRSLGDSRVQIGESTLLYTHFHGFPNLSFQSSPQRFPLNIQLGSTHKITLIHSSSSPRNWPTGKSTHPRNSTLTRLYSPHQIVNNVTRPLKYSQAPLSTLRRAPLRLVEAIISYLDYPPRVSSLAEKLPAPSHSTATPPHAASAAPRSRPRPRLQAPRPR